MKHEHDVIAEEALKFEAKQKDMSVLEARIANIKYYFTQKPPKGTWDKMHQEDVMWCVDRLNELEKEYDTLKKELSTE